MTTSKPGPVVVVGSLNMDLVVRVPHMPAAGETLTGEDFSAFPGGKGANQAVAAARMEAPVAMVGRVGDHDAYAATLLAGLQSDGIALEHVRAAPGTHTGVAVIVVEANGQNRIVLAPGANAAVDDAAIDAAGALIDGASIVVLQLEVPMRPVVRTAERARRAGVTVLLNVAPVQPLPDVLWGLIDILVVNEGEASALAGIEVVDAATAAQAATALRQRGPTCVIVTLGADGVVLADAAGIRAQRAHEVQPVDTTAAGDTFIGAIAAAWREGLPLDEAVALGQAASALCVTRRGAQPSIPHRRELVGAYAPHRDTARTP